MEKKKTIIIKISGGSLKGKNGIFDVDQINNLVKQIKLLQKNYNIVIIIGGGNIFRGMYAKQFDISRNDADNMGMLATTINAVLLESVLKKDDFRVKVFNSIPTESICETYTPKKVIDALSSEYVCILASGTGNSYFSTDSGIALRAAQLNADFILMGKNGVDGVYDKDPNKFINAKRFDKLTYCDILNMNLEIMDKTALTICEENNIKIIVFNIDKDNSIIDALNNKCLTTIISK
ncbi:MAG: UMP kinase [Ureaplasma sp.]|nr:UMP kinase [Ureaplasma sp.]